MSSEKSEHEFRLFASSRHPDGFDPNPTLLASGMTRWDGKNNEDMHLLQEEFRNKGLMPLFRHHLDKFISVDIALGKQYDGPGASHPAHTIVLRYPVAASVAD